MLENIQGQPRVFQESRTTVLIANSMKVLGAQASLATLGTNDQTVSGIKCPNCLSENKSLNPTSGENTTPTKYNRKPIQCYFPYIYLMLCDNISHAS